MATPVIPVEDLIVVLSDGRVVAAQPVYVVPDSDPVQDAAGRWVDPTPVYYSGGGGPSGALTLSNNEIQENSPEDTLIGTFTVDGESSGWNFLLIDNPPTIQLVGNQLFTTDVPLDYEDDPAPTFKVNAAQANPYLTITKEFSLDVLNLPDTVLTNLTFSSVGPFALDTPPGTLLATLGNLEDADDITIVPDDGTVVLNAEKTAILKGLEAWTSGPRSYQVLKYLARAPNSPLATDWAATITVTATVPEIEVLTPGTTAFGAWTATATDDASLPPQGSAGQYGYTKKPSAAWDTVMYDEFTDEFTIGVSAWKAPTYADYALGRVDGIKEVQFSADDGPWVTVATRGTSPRTGVGDLFLVRVRAADYATARLTEVRAKVIPWSGKPRILQGFPVIGSNIAQKFARAEQYSLALTANKDGALNRPVRYLSPTGSDANSGLTAEAPMATRDAAVTSLLAAVGGSDIGGCKLLLLPGTYGEFGQPGAWENAAGTNSEIIAAASRWVSVEAVTPGTVTMGSTTPRGLNVIKTKYKNISFVQGVIGTGSGSATNAEGALWIDGCSFNGLVSSDPETKLGNTVTSLGNGGLWFTASLIANHLNGPAGSNTVLAQNTHLDGVDGELFTDVRSVQQCSAKNSKRLGDAHPDTYQWRDHGADVRRNYVLYRLVADENIAAQGFFSDKSGQCNDAAVVDCSFGAVGVANAFILNNAPSNLFFLRLSVAPGTVKLAWTNTADNVRFVDNRTISPRTYREGVSYLEAGMAASEPYDGPPPPSTIIEALGDSASGGKVTYVYDAIRTDKLTLILTEGDSGPRASYWSSTATASLGLTQSTDALRPYYDTVGFKGIAPAVVYDKTDGSARVVGVTSIPSPLSAQNECDIYMAVEHNVDAASPMATDTQYWLFAGASSSATGQFSIRRSIVAGLHRVSVYSPIGPSGGAVTSTINAYVEDASFIGPMIIRVKKRLGAISITVYNDANPNGITASTTTGSDVPTLPTSSTRFRIGSSYNNPLDQTVQGNILNLSITAPLTDEEAVLALNALREDGGFQ